MAERKLLPCPFCGCPGEIYTGRQYDDKHRVFLTEAEARSWLEENAPADSTKREVYPLTGRKAGKWMARFNRPAYIARCTNTRCVARSVAKRRIEQQAIDLWNRRADHGKA